MNVPSSRRVRFLVVSVVVLVGLVLLAIGIRHVIQSSRNRLARPAVAAVTHFADDFSSRSGWATSSGKTADLSYAEGGYRLKLDRRADDGLSILVLPGDPLPAVAVSTVVVDRGGFGGLVGVGCAAGKERAYLGAVDPAGEGFVILRVNETEMTLLRYGANEEGTIRQAGEENELQVQCTVQAGADRGTLIRLFANGRLLAAYEDPAGLGPFKGVALAGISLRHPLDAMFERVALQTLPAPDRGALVATACGRLTAVTSAESDYGWLVDSGGTSLNSLDFDTRQVVRIARELRRLSTDLREDARALGASKARRAVQTLAAQLHAQGDSLNALTNALNRGPVDASGPSASLSCRTPRFLTPPYRGSRRSTGGAPHPNVAWRTSRGRDLDRRLIRDLPAPDFIPDDTPPLKPEVHVDVDLTYRSFRVFGSSLAELDRSLRMNAIRVEGEHAAGVTDSRFEWTYQLVEGASGCRLAPGVTLTLKITLPDWKRPASVDRYLRNQWNEFMWDLDDHERHHAELWVKAANRMIVAINGVPPGPSCSRVVEVAKDRVAKVFRTYDQRQRAFDRGVAAGRLPGPSLP